MVTFDREWLHKELTAESIAEESSVVATQDCLWARNGHAPCPRVQPAQQGPIAVQRWLWIFENKYGDKYTTKGQVYTHDEAAESAKILGVKSVGPTGSPVISWEIGAAPQSAQAPVAWMYDTIAQDGSVLRDWVSREHPRESALEDERPHNFRPLYTAPQPRREPLTDEEIAKIKDGYSNEYGLEDKYARDFARAIEAAHGIAGETK